MAVWMNKVDAFPSTVPGGPNLGGTAATNGVLPNVIAVNPMAFSYKKFIGTKDYGIKFDTTGQDPSNFVGADDFVQDFIKTEKK